MPDSSCSIETTVMCESYSATWVEDYQLVGYYGFEFNKMQIEEEQDE